MIKDVPVQDGSSRKQIASPFKFSAGKPEYRHVGVELGKQTDIVLKELGYTLEQIKKLKNIKIKNLSIVLMTTLVTKPF